MIDSELLGPELNRQPVTHAVLVDAVRLYRKHFRLFASLVVLPTLAGTFAMWLSSNRIANLTRDIPRTIEGFRTVQSSIILEATVLRFCGFLGIWLCWAFAFSAVAVAVLTLSAGRSVDPEECFNYARENPGKFLALCGYLFLKMVILSYVIGFALLVGPYQIIERFMGPVKGYFLGVFLVAIIAVIVLPFMLAIPVTTFEGLGLRDALKRSFKLTEGKSLVMLGLFIEAELSSYLFSLLLRWFIYRGFDGAGIPTLYNSVFYLEIAGLALLQPIVMIGFALIYNSRIQGNPGSHSQADSQVPHALYS